MKKTLIFLLFILLLPLASLAQPVETNREIEIQEQIVKVEEEIDRLSGKLKLAGTAVKKEQLKSLIFGHEARLAKLKSELEDLKKPKVEEVVVEQIPTKEAVVKEPWIKFEIGGMGGVFAAATGIFGEIRLPMALVYGPATSSLRLAGSYAQSENTARRYATLHADGIFNFPPGVITGVENYLGAGLNYVVLTTGRTAGTVGGELFYGIDGKGFGGKLFAELGYAILRTGFSPSHKGATVLVGYRRDWSF